MATSQMNGVIQHLRRTMLLRGGAGLTDGQLLTDYLSRRDEAALAALVHRHGPMVWGVCRRVLHDHHDAEDAFQASFLVLVRKAASINSRELLANWLYGVAHQTALKARATVRKRKGRERQVTQMPEPAVAEQDLWTDLQPLLDEELRRLPDKYRAVVVLCDLEERTRKEVAGQLGCPEGTVAGRLARARRMLAKQLAQRGVVLSGGALAAVLSQNVAAAGVPPAVVLSTIKVATLFAAGQAANGAISAKVAALTAGVLKAMFVTKIKSVLAMVLVIAALTGAAGLLYRTQATAKEEPGVAKKDQNPAQPRPQAVQTDQQRMVGKWTVVSEGNRKGHIWWISEDRIFPNPPNPNFYGYYIHIQWSYRLDSGKTPKQIDITFPNAPLSKGIYALDGDELRLCLGESGKDRPAAFPNPGAGAVLILRRAPTPQANAGKPKGKEERLRELIDSVLAAHGGEDRLNKLQFMMTVKHSNGETQQYFVQPPKSFRWETTHRDRPGKRIVILFPQGRRWWRQEPNEQAREMFLTGIEPPVESWYDYVKFFGPREVLRLKDPDHKVALLDKEVKIGDRAAVGVQITGPRCNGKMYFDKETHLLVNYEAPRKRDGVPFAQKISDYKMFDGIPIAQKENDGYFLPEVLDFRAVDKLDPKLFEQP